MDADHERALGEEKAMKELSAELNTILGRIDKLNMSELSFLDDAIIDEVIAIGHEIDAKDPYRATHQDILNRLTTFVGGVKVRIVATNVNVNYSSVVVGV